MNSFLFRVAEAYFTHYKQDISNFTFVFPNRRAGLFFRKYIAQLTPKPLFSPEICTINECFEATSELQNADRLSNLFLIYQLYKSVSQTDESFDAFVFWGDMLLTDFDQVDKYLVDAKQLFTNITELNEIDRLYNVFTDRQIEAIRQFWKNFVPVVEGKTKEEFIATWKVLYELYTQFRNVLLAKGLATEGMMCRMVAEQLQQGKQPSYFAGKQFVFVGFNALNPCENKLMSELQKSGQADFYWDYEADELRDAENPASLFYAQNVHVFHSKFSLPVVKTSLHDKQIKLIGIPSAVGMTNYIQDILQQISNEKPDSESWINTAVVLPDENLLLPMLYALPPSIDKINVTMGYPVSATPVSGLIHQLFELHRRARASNSRVSFYYKNVSDILNHQYVSTLCNAHAQLILRNILNYNKIYIDSTELQSNTLLQAIFHEVDTSVSFTAYLLHILRLLQSGWKQLDTEEHSHQLECDFLYQYYLTINRIQEIIAEKSNDVELSMDTLARLIQQLTASITIPFVGEPLDGLQIMGVLESRGLDFDHLIIPSFNEGVFPKKTAAHSFIPYSLSKGFGLPTFEHQDAIASYNFYRLLHRAKHIYLLYDTRTDTNKSGEMSRYVHQLNYHYGVKIENIDLNYDMSYPETKPVQVIKTPEIIAKFQSFFRDDEAAKYLSPSSIKTYIECPLQFYLSRIENINKTDEVLDKVEESMFGTLFHEVMEYIYKPLSGKLVSAETIEAIIKNQLLVDKYIQKAFSRKFFKKQNDELVSLEGGNLLIASVIRKYVLKVLEADKNYAPFTLLGAEIKMNTQLDTRFGKVNIYGVIDRIDKKEGSVRILDYKSGAGNLNFNTLTSVFEHNNDKRPKYVLQTLLYGMLFKANDANQLVSQNQAIVPGIIYLREIFKDSYSTALYNKLLKAHVDSYTNLEVEFVEHLKLCVEEIFDPSIPFFQSESIEPCKYCSFTGICNR
ncbi:MAG: hypothetical protein AUK44_08020 [Porphyromonadaceae bacterium CG2_30_38_12]|nr:MAG: hypothetical protein AUK44_08020 [Porphyromonadaceae bacterium CG2_30_38_12]